MTGLLTSWLALALMLGGGQVLPGGIELERGTVAPCAGWRLDGGEPAHARALASGFYRPNRSGRGFAWARRRAAVWMVLADRPGPRRLVLTGRAVVDGMTVSASVNGVDLGDRELSRRWRESSWPLAPDAVRPGPNLFVFRSSTERLDSEGRRRLALAIDELRIEPEASNCPAEAVDPDHLPALPETLAAGAVLTAPLLVPPEGRLRLQVGGRPGAVVDVLVGLEEERWPAGAATVPPSGAGLQEVVLTGCCGFGRRLVLVGRGPGAVELGAMELTGEGSVSAWRRACKAWIREILLVAGLGGLFLLSARRSWRLPLRRWAPWIDVLLVVAVALVVRQVYLGEYPHSNPNLFPDAGEYLQRARSLAFGQTTVLGDLYWHRWQTWLRPPGYYFFLAQLFKLGISGVASVARIQTLFFVATAAGTYSLAYVLFGRAAALVAGLCYALSLEALTFSSVIASEALFLLLLVPALTLLARLSKRPSIRLAAVAGLLFGLAALVRSAPAFYVPAAAVLLGLGQGFRRTIGPMVALVLGMAVVVVPWSVRNSLLTGKPMGIDNMAVANFLASHPDELYLDPGSLDLDTDEGWRAYYWRIKLAGGQLASKPILSRGLGRLLTHPADTLRSSLRGLSRFFHPFGHHFSRYVGESEPCRVAAITGLLNWYLFAVLISALAAAVALIGQRSTWPVLFWFLLILGTACLLFERADLPRYRFSTLPVLLAYAGWGLARLHEMLGRALGGARDPTLSGR